MQKMSATPNANKLIFPESVNGKSPDQMNPDEFEEYLGLQADGNLAAAAGFDHQEFYYGTEPVKNRDFAEGSIQRNEEDD